MQHLQKTGGPLQACRPSQILFYRRGNDFAKGFAQSGHSFLRQTRSLDGVVQMNSNLRRPEHPVPRPVMLNGSHQTNRYDGNTELLRDAEAAILELIHLPVARSLGFGKNDEAGPAVDGILREPPHALQIRRPPHIRNGDIAESLHQPAVSRNLEVRFQLPSPHKLRNGAVKHKRIEEIDVIRHEESSSVGVEAGGAADFDLRGGKKRNAPAETALQPIMFARIQENAEKKEQRNNEKEIETAYDLKNRAAGHEP